MSYCVHCGVSLADSQQACPLCGTPVVDPARQPDSTSKPMFVEHAVDKRRVNPRFIASLTFLLLTVPFIVIAIVDLCVPANLHWALYVIAGLLVSWVLIFLPLHLPRRRPYTFLLVDAAAVTVLLAFIAAFTHGWRWFLILGLPFTALAFGAALMLTFVFRRPSLNIGTKAAWTLIIAAVLVMLVGVGVGLYRGTSVLPLWGWVSAIPCVVLGVLLLILSSSDRFCAWAERRLFI